LSPTVTRTSTPTHTPTRTGTAVPTRTPTPSPAPNLLAKLPKIDRQWTGLGLVIISAIGLVLVLIFSFIRKPEKKE